MPLKMLWHNQFLNPLTRAKCPTVGLLAECKTATLSRTILHIFLLFVISHLQVQTIVQIFVHVGVEPYATFKERKTKLYLTPPHPRADLHSQCPTVGKGKCMKKCPTNARGMSRLGIDPASKYTPTQSDDKQRKTMVNKWV